MEEVSEGLAQRLGLTGAEKLLGGSGQVFHDSLDVGADHSVGDGGKNCQSLFLLLVQGLFGSTSFRDVGCHANQMRALARHARDGPAAHNQPVDVTPQISHAGFDEEGFTMVERVANLLLEGHEIFRMDRFEERVATCCEYGCGRVEDLLRQTRDHQDVVLDSPFPAHRPASSLHELQLDFSIPSVVVSLFEGGDIEGGSQHGHGTAEEDRLNSQIDPGRLAGRLEELDLVVKGGPLLQVVLDGPPRPGMNELDEGLPEELSCGLSRELPTGWVDVQHLDGVEDEKGRRSAFDQRVESLIGSSWSHIHLASIIGPSNGWRYSLFHTHCPHVAYGLGLSASKDGAAGEDVPRWPAAIDRRAHLIRGQVQEELNVKKAVWILCLALTMMATVSPGQEINDEIELTRSIIQTQRQAIVTAAMQLTGEESQTFWPLYHEYREAMRKVDDRSVTLINGYAESFDTMTDEIAQTMLKEFMSIRQAELEVTRKYLKRFQKILPANKVARFFQLENKLDSVIDFELASEIPLVP